MRKRREIWLIALMFTLLASLAYAQSPNRAKKSKDDIQAAAPNPVGGSGPAGQIAKWTGVFGSNTFTLGGSNITEDKFGKIGIGTAMPTSLFTVQGIIETTLGGVRFPDGTLQTTAAISSVFHDPTLAGNGTISSPLGIAPGGVNTIHLANSAVTGPKIAFGTVVRSVNGFFDNVSILAGSNVSLSQGANTLTIATTGLLNEVARDATLMGDGTSGAPLGLAVPLSLFGSQNGPTLSASNGGGTSSGILGKSGSGSFPPCPPSGVCGVSGVGHGVSGASLDSVGVSGDSGAGTGVRGTSFDSIGVFGRSGSSFPLCPASGVCGTSSSNIGVAGRSTSANGLDGFSDDGNGVSGFSNFAAGVRGSSTQGIGVQGISLTGGLAGEFQGSVEVTGMLSKGGGSFKIDHPLDPENRYLYHSFVESPDMMNLYNGNAITDENGEATVEMPEYFQALNRDFRYQLTVIGTFAQAIIAEEIEGNHFKIRTSAPNVKVSWQVTGTRQDGWAQKNRIKVEVEKPERERGYYLHPEAFDQPEERGIGWAHNPATMRQLRESREQVLPKTKGDNR